MAFLDNKHKYRAYDLVRKFNREKDWVKKYSRENLELLKLILDLTLEGLQFNKGKKFVKIPKQIYLNQDIPEAKVISFLDWISENFGVFTVINDEYKKAIYDNKLMYFINKLAKLDNLQIYPHDTSFNAGDEKENILFVIRYPGRVLKLLEGIREYIDNELAISQKERKLEIPNWSPNESGKRGILVLPSGEIEKFHGGRFGAINILVKYFDHYIDKKDLREAIDKYNQKGTDGKLILSKWKDEFKDDHPLFFKYFDIDLKTGLKCKMYWKSS